MSVSFQCRVFSGRGLCVGLITHPEEFYLVHVCVCVCVSECDREVSVMRRPWSTKCCCAMREGGILVCRMRDGVVR